MKPNIAVIGCGYWGKNLIRTFSKLGVLFAVSDINPEVAKKYADEYGVECLGWTEILEHPYIDGVVIATPAAMHAEQAGQALSSGKHVFVEKPLSLKVKDAELLCEFSERYNRRLMVGHILSYHPAFCKLKEVINKGQLGRIQYVYSNRLNLGKIRREEDILWSFAPHDISMILSIIGSEPVDVKAIGGFYLHKTIADITTTHLFFPGGEQAHIFVSWLHPFKEQKLIVVGDRGMAVFDDGQSWNQKLLIYPYQIEWREGMPLPSKAEAIAVPLKESEPLAEECAHFIECIKEGTTPRTDGREGLKVLKVLDKASKSLNGQTEISKGEVRSIQQNSRFPEATIHESAYIDENVEIGKDTKIWHFSHILPNTQIGKNNNIGQNVTIGPNVKIGNNCKIQNNVSIYTGITLEDGVFCGPSCVFTNVNTPRAEVNRRSEYKLTNVGKGATIGANATIVCGHNLGAYCFIAAGAVVTKDIPPYALVAGVPAKQIGWVSETGERLGEDLICPRTRQQYCINKDGQLEKEAIKVM